MVNVLSIFLLWLYILLISHAVIQFPPIFKGGAVLQHSIDASVWGTNAIGEVTLFLNNVFAATAVVTASGNWSARLPPTAPGFNYTLTAHDSKSGNISVIVSFGITILCSGQSNMGMPVWNKEGGFQAWNGTAEVAAAGRYSGKIWLKKTYSQSPKLQEWFSVTPDSLQKPGFSAVCWYAAKGLFEHMGGTTAIGLIYAAIGGSPIEYWISSKSIAACEVDVPQCDNKWNDTAFYTAYIVPLFPFPIGAVLWDQAERDVKCPTSVHAYPCMQKQLITSWRQGFNTSFVFVGVQLHGYTAVLANGTGRYNLSVTSEMVFNMRMAQEAGVEKFGKAQMSATYDLSCPLSPFGSVHNPDKIDVGTRLALHLRYLLLGEKVTIEGPRATKIVVESVKTLSRGLADYTITVHFVGGTTPFYLNGTRNCITCCNKSLNPHTIDFDVSADGVSWTNSTNAEMIDLDKVKFHVVLASPPAMVRHTAASIWPQCALYNAEGLPALPFQMDVSPSVVV